MSEEIDIQKITGDMGPAAVDQPVETNSYLQETEEFPVAPAPVEVVPPEQSKQELNFKALRDEVDRLKASRDTDKQTYDLQLEMMKANLVQQKQPIPDRERPKEMFESMGPEDIPNVAELRSEFKRELEAREVAYQSRIEELEVATKYPDYAEVIEKYALPLVKEKPHLAEGIQGARNKAMFAYELGKMAQQMRPAQEPTRPSENAQRIVENSKKPGTLSQAGGQSALSKADYYATMSDQEFLKFASRNLDQI